MNFGSFANRAIMQMPHNQFGGAQRAMIPQTGVQRLAALNSPTKTGYMPQQGQQRLAQLQRRRRVAVPVQQSMPQHMPTQFSPRNRVWF